MPSRKLLVAIGVSTVGLTLIGLGVRATFTTSVSVTETISTGSVNALITDATWQTTNVDGGLTTPIEVGGAPFNPGVSSVNLGVSGNNGSNINEVYNITVENSGTLPMNITCTLSGTAGDTASMNTELGVYDTVSDDYYGQLDTVETNGTNVCADTVTQIAASSTAVIKIQLQGILSTDSMGGTITPVLTVNGSDTGSGGNNPPGLP